VKRAIPPTSGRNARGAWATTVQEWTTEQSHGVEDAVHAHITFIHGTRNKIEAKSLRQSWVDALRASGGPDLLAKEESKSLCYRSRWRHSIGKYLRRPLLRKALIELLEL
jgi:hypothetical protein